MHQYSDLQLQIAENPPADHTFLEGVAGTGKTTAGVARLRSLLNNGIPASQILILVPQRTLATPYHNLLRESDLPAGSTSDIVTLGGLGQRMINLFWPLVAEPAGFHQPDQPPIFLTMETAQYYLARLIEPLLAQGYFNTVHADRNRLMSQILDNLNKSAVVGFHHTEIAERLISSWVGGDPAQHHIYNEAQECANLFRQHCLENNLLDFSLQYEAFAQFLWRQQPLCQSYLSAQYRHLIYDNVEEDVPLTHDIIREWLPEFETALLIYDTEGGYRAFLGADTQSGYALKETCQADLLFEHTWVTTPPLLEFEAILTHCIANLEIDPDSDIELARRAYELEHKPYFPEMIDRVCSRAAQLIHENNIPPGEIVILSPFLSDSLRFSLMDRLNQLEIPSRSHRPSRSLGDEPVTRGLLTFAKLAHPHWGMVSSQFDLSYALMTAIDGLDLVRADLLSKIIYHPNRFEQGLGSFDAIAPNMQDRITFSLGERYEKLRSWLQTYRENPPFELDAFLKHLFGEVLSQPGFGFHTNLDAPAVTARLIDSIAKFRRATQHTITTQDQNAAIPETLAPELRTGYTYIRMVEEGVIAAQYLQNWRDFDEDAVLLAPAYTFLMMNNPVDCQLWLDIGSLGWWERLYQPLTHPYILSRAWAPGIPWTDVMEVETNQQNLVRLVSGLIHRCRESVFPYAAGMNEQGNEQRGPLLQAMQVILRHSAGSQANGEAHDE